MDDELQHEHDDLTVTREFVRDVREAAGWRVSPRQVTAALEAIDTAEENPTPERVAEVVSALQGDRSQRQRRHADLWRVLGAQLAVRDEPADPDAQRAFIAEARDAAGPSPSDALLLQVALQMAATGGPLEPRAAGEVSRWMHRNTGRSLSDDEITEALPDAIDAVADAREQARRAQQRRRKRESTFEVEPVARTPGRSTGRRPRGSSFGGKRRRRSQP